MRKSKWMSIVSGILLLINALFMVGLACYVVYLLFGSIGVSGLDEPADNGFAQLFQGVLAGLVFLVYAVFAVIAGVALTISIVALVRAIKTLKLARLDPIQYEKKRGGIIFTIVWFFIVAGLLLMNVASSVVRNSQVISIIMAITMIIANVLLIIDMAKSRKEAGEYHEMMAEAKTVSTSLVDQVMELDKLKTSGQITAEEYTNRRAELVAKEAEAKKNKNEDLFKAK